MAFEDLRESVTLYNCDRCGFTAKISELVEDPASPGMLVHPANSGHRCADKVGFNESKADDPHEMGDNYFK